MAHSPELSPESFEPVHLLKHFDLQTYRELGLELSRLEDPSSDGLLRRVRIASANYLTLKDTKRGPEARGALYSAYGRLSDEMKNVEEGYSERYRGTTVEHPAIQAYADRNPSALENASTDSYFTSESLLMDATRRSWLISLALIRPNEVPTGDGDEPAPKWRMVEGPAIGITSPLEVADQLVVARIAVGRIFGL